MAQIFGLENYFYHGSIKRYVTLFGSIFSDIHIKRIADDGSKEEVIKIPIRYGHGNMYMKVAQDETRETAKHSRVLPAMAFELDDFSKDTHRKTNPMNRLTTKAADSEGKKDFQLNRIPYNFEFILRIRTKNTDDMMQIAEQIIPAFDGNLSITVEDNNGVNIEQDIIVSIGDMRMEDNFDDGMKVRLIEWIIKFELKGYLYKRTQSAYVIKEIDIIGQVGEDVDSVIEKITRQDPIQDKQNILSSMTSMVDDTPTTPIKATRRRTRKE